MAGLLYISVFVIQLWASQGSNLEPPVSSVKSSPILTPPVSILLAPFSLEGGQLPQIKAPEPETKTEGHTKRYHEIVSEGAFAGIIFGILFGVFFAAGARYIYVTRKINIRRSNSIRVAV
ncbi:hypothetical protein SUGI_1127710 [Cryptomeria japonica]|uniref:uncharacterized protein LOC131041098 n=1 Tax=Cryptomeria japonica TaxID=3369 RepID=UPI002414B96C|nr:uncharacterized protein LOC131041098 [Cryptomeria japonica]GLJ52940.1 hypothetical protein SUGI_1127710 [Cryptomeria japonica]